MLSRAISCVILQLLFFITCSYGEGYRPQNAIFSTTKDESCRDSCLGLTCTGVSHLLSCEESCVCTPRCNLFCPNGDCLAYCSCFKADEVGIGDVVAAKFDNSVYVVNRTQIPNDFSNRTLLHGTLLAVNQTWWQACDDGRYYEEPYDCGSRRTPGSCFSCQMECETFGAVLGCFSSCGCSQKSEGCGMHCSTAECETLCTCNRF